MEFGLRALMNEMLGPFPREYMENIPTASSMRKKTYRRQPLRRAAVASDLNLDEEIPVPKPRPEVPRSPYNKSFSIFGLPVGEVQKDGTFFAGDYKYRNLPLPSQSEKGTLDPNYSSDQDGSYKYLETMPTPTGSRERPIYADPRAMDELHPHFKYRDGKIVSIGNTPIPQSRPKAPSHLNLNEQQPIKQLPATPQPQAGVKERGYVTSLPSGTRRAPNAMTQTQLPGGQGTVSGMTADQFRDSMRRTEQGLTPSPFGKAMGKLSKTLERIRGGIDRRLPSQLNRQRFGRPDMDTNPYGYIDPTKANPIDRDRYIRSTGDRNEEGYLATVYGPHPT